MSEYFFHSTMQEMHFYHLSVEVWPRTGRIRPRTERVVIEEYTGDVPVSTGILPPELI